MIAMVMPAESLENPESNLVRDKDRPPRDGIRLLGRILGETVRDEPQSIKTRAKGGQARQMQKE